MGMMKEMLIEEKIGVEEVEEGLKWLCMWGKKSFKAHTGEWVEVRCAKQPDFFEVDETPIPHVLEKF